MIKPFQVITQGRLSTVTRRALLIAVLGYLSFLDPVTPVDYGGGGKDTSEISRLELRRRIQMDDEEILIILKAFTNII